MTRQPFHDGEIAVQERAGERTFARRNGVGISPDIGAGALSFLTQQRLAALTTAGADGALWTSVWFGEPGFVHSDDGQHVSIRLTAAQTAQGDPVRPRLVAGGDVGMLVIDLATRRRLRVNGSVDDISDREIGIRVRECVSNCPKYIQRRRLHDTAGGSSPRIPGASGRALDKERRAIVEQTDTAFVGSVHPERGMDTSHRGGEPGFIRIVDAATVRVPDYPGNSMFMTLGNFEADARASLAVMDFEHGRMVSLSGSARLHFDVEDPRYPTGGTGRYWEFSLREWVQFELPPTLRWERLDASPYNPPAPDGK